MYNKLAHTAEHAFIGSLQKILGSTLSVRKVEHREKDSTVIIKLPQLDLQTVIKAQQEVNFLIDSGKNIKTHRFETLDKAKERFPSLRANEDRIKEKKESVRVIEIEGHDIAACAMEHASNLCECEFFLVTRMSKAGGNAGYEINFVVQSQAKEASMILSWKLLRICQDLGANINTVEDTVKKLDREEKIKTLKLKKLTTGHLDKIMPSSLENGKVNLIQDILYSLDDDEIRSFVGKIASHSEERTIILLAHIPNDNEENASVTFARTQSLEHIDCNKLFNQYSSLGARGGGKPTFLTGVINKEKIHQLMNHLVTDIRNTLRDRPL
jgi:alanyl-tRNA synthetase